MNRGTFDDRTFRNLLLWGLALFILAGSTGFLYRLGLLGLMPGDLYLTNIRHAHSHLMFFGWITPVPMLFIARKVILEVPSTASSFYTPLFVLTGLSLLTYPSFLFFGYTPVTIGTATLPLSVMLSGCIMIVWYWFIIVYLKFRKSCEESSSKLLYEAALFMLFLSSLGAWGVAVLQSLNVDNALMTSSMTHFFLAVFTEGWCVLVALGLLYQFTGESGPVVNTYWLITPVVLGVPLTFPFGLSAGMVTGPLLFAAGLGACLVIIGLLMNFYQLYRFGITGMGTVWKIIFLLLGIKIVLQAGSVLLPSTVWIGEAGLRVLYLHLVLLGFASLAIVASWHQLIPAAGKSGLYLMTGSVLLVLLTLVMISGLLHVNYLPENIYQIVAVVALLPVVSGMWEWIRLKSDTAQGF